MFFFFANEFLIAIIYQLGLSIPLEMQYFLFSNSLIYTILFKTVPVQDPSLTSRCASNNRNRRDFGQDALI
jgi:hypothetical protein